MGDVRDSEGGRPREFDWVLSVAFTREQAALIQRRASENDVPFRQAVRDIFDAGAKSMYPSPVRAGER